MNIILASQSPRRKELMKLLSLPFTIRVADIDEHMAPDKPPYDEVARVSREKAAAINCDSQDIVIAADTIVVCEGNVLGKPADDDEAFRTLSLLSGKIHQVMTGLTVRQGDRCVTCTEVSDIYFRSLSPEEIRHYIATGDCRDKAGAYGIQSGGALFVEKLVGDFYNVMGLPVCRLNQILKSFLEEAQ